MKFLTLPVYKFKSNLEFEGYWQDDGILALPGYSGIYCVYSCTHNSEGNIDALNELLYIGESEYIQNGIVTHECRSEWKSMLKENEELCYSCAYKEKYRDFIVDSLIYGCHSGPTCNKDHDKLPDLSKFFDKDPDVKDEITVKVIIGVTGASEFFDSKINLTLSF